MAARTLETTLPEPFVQLSFLALSVILSLNITDHGLIDVEKFKLTAWLKSYTFMDPLANFRPYSRYKAAMYLSIHEDLGTGTTQRG